MNPADIRSAYLAAEGFEAVLGEELERAGLAVTWHGRLALSAGAPIDAAWSLDTWTRPTPLPAPSIGAAADGLRAMQRNWGLYDAAHHRRAKLIAERLPPVKARPLDFPAPAPTGHLGAWTLLAPDLVLASPTKTSPFVNGVCAFNENRVDPPSRAYLKLWEALTRLGVYPGTGETCFDLGACPGGWTWVLASLGARVTAVDKAPLDPAVVAMPGVGLRLESAFGLEPEKVDWLFSDIIAYPARLRGLIERWIGAGAARRIVCTIKFQGATDHETAEALAAIPGAWLAHLFHNKHELTFFWSADGSGRPATGLS